MGFPSQTHIWEDNCILQDDRATPFGRGPYYGYYVQQKCNRPDARATLSGRGPDMVLRGTHYGKPVAQLSVQTLSVTVRTPPREICSKLVLGLLRLYIESSRHVLLTQFGIEFFTALRVYFKEKL